MTSPAQLLCSTRYQVIRTYETYYPRIAQALDNILLSDLIRIIQECYGVIEGEADIPYSQAGNTEMVTTRWQQLQDNRVFQTIALSSDLFRFAIHGIEHRLPPDLDKQFRLIEQRIPTLYPKERRITIDWSHWSTTLISSALDLPRIPPCVSSASFDPYDPEKWSRPAEGQTHSADGVPFWRQRRIRHEVTAMNAMDRDNHLPRNPTALNQAVLLGSIRTPQGNVYCRLVFQDISCAGSIDTLTSLDIYRERIGALHELSWLPIACPVVGSTPYDSTDQVDWALCASTACHSTKKPFNWDFIYHRVREEPDPKNASRDVDSKLPEAETLYDSSRTNAPPSSATATAQKDPSSNAHDESAEEATLAVPSHTNASRDVDSKLPEADALYGSSRTNAPPTTTATAQKDPSSSAHDSSEEENTPSDQEVSSRTSSATATAQKDVSHAHAKK